MSIETIILILILSGVAVAIFLLVKQNTNKDEFSENKEAEEIVSKLKEY